MTRVNYSEEKAGKRNEKAVRDKNNNNTRLSSLGCPIENSWIFFATLPKNSFEFFLVFL